MATGVTSGTSVAKSSFKETIQKALRIKERTGSLEKYEKYLHNQGFSKTKEQHSYTLPNHDEPDGPSTEEISESDLDITIYLWVDCSGNPYYGELNWSYNFGYYNTGADPVDVAGIGYDSSWWDLHSYSISETTEASTYVTPNDDYFDGSGPGFDVNDWNAYQDGEDTGHYAGVYIEPVGSYGTDERRIQGAYTHTWSSGSVTGGGASWPAGISISVESTTEKWRTRTKQDGDTLLRLAQSDAQC